MVFADFSGAWESFKGYWGGTTDYLYDGFCQLGPSAWTGMKNSWNRQWGLVSNPIGYGKNLWDKTVDFARQIPGEMNWNSFRSGCVGAAESFFPKNAMALSSRNQSLDDYSRAYISQQANMEQLTFLGGLMFAGVGRAGRVGNGLTRADTFVKSDSVFCSQEAYSVNAGLKLNRKLAAEEIAHGHAFIKHGNEFGFSNSQQMASHIENVMTNPSKTRFLSNGRVAYWDDATQSVVIRNPHAMDGGTIFKPKNGFEYFLHGLH